MALKNITRAPSIATQKIFVAIRERDSTTGVRAKTMFNSHKSAAVRKKMWPGKRTAGAKQMMIQHDIRTDGISGGLPSGFSRTSF